MKEILNKSQIHLQASVHSQQCDIQEHITFSMHWDLLLQRYNEIIQKNLIYYLSLFYLNVKLNISFWGSL